MKTIKDGNWNDQEVWDENRVPTKNDVVDINNKISVTSPVIFCSMIIVNTFGEIEIHQDTTVKGC